MRWRFSLNADSMALAMSYWPRRYSKDKVERERLPPWAKKSWRFGRFSGGAGVIEMGAVVDNVDCLEFGRHAGFAISIIEGVANK